MTAPLEPGEELPPGFIPRPEDLSQFFLSFLYPGPAYEATSDDRALQGAHVGYVWKSQMPGGPALAGGPVFPPRPAPAEGAPLLGIMVLRSQTQAEAEAVAAADPGVVAGRFRVVVYRWLVPKGRLPEEGL